MEKFIESRDKYGRITAIRTPLQGQDLLAVSELNKGSSFSLEERKRFGLLGKLPASIQTPEEQLDRFYKQFQSYETDIEKNIFLNQLKQHNETIFYMLASAHLDEMMPIVYTPTIGDAVKQFSFQFNQPVGLFLSYEYQDHLDDIFDQVQMDAVDIALITDGEGVLGIGDWGTGGIDISIGKLMVYTLCGGIDPSRVLPIQLDVGTNNKALIDDPMYLGWRHERITGDDYDAFIDKVVTAILKRFPKVYIHWEDFGRGNAHRVLNHYRKKHTSFNDDIQGTGATASACILSAMKAANANLSEQRFVFLGAGTAGTGVADQLCQALIHSGVAVEDAQKQFWMIDRDGLITSDMDDLTDNQKVYAREQHEMRGWDLQQVVDQVKPTVLIGCSTVKGAFTESVVKSMAQHVDHPIIFPLSNPTSLAEATPKDLIEWTQGRVIVATGSPFDPVDYNGKTIRISQCNNAFIFPGLGLGVLVSQATEVTDGMIAAACDALSDYSPARKDPSAPVLPSFDHVHEISQYIALKVAEQAIKDGVNGCDKTLDLEQTIKARFWLPVYHDYELVE